LEYASRQLDILECTSRGG